MVSIEVMWVRWKDYKIPIWNILTVQVWRRRRNTDSRI
jgi:hypothetical protein